MSQYEFEKNIKPVSILFEWNVFGEIQNSASVELQFCMIFFLTPKLEIYPKDKFCECGKH